MTDRHDAWAYLPTIAAIQHQVTRYYGIRPNEFASPRRERRVAHPRQIAMFIAHDACPKNTFGRYSQKNIGRMFGGRDHSTVHHAIVETRRRIASDDAECAKLMAVLIDLYLETARAA